MSEQSTDDTEHHVECVACRWEGTVSEIDPECPECGTIALIKADTDRSENDT